MIRTFKDLAKAMFDRIEVCVNTVGEDDLDAQHDWYDNDGDTVMLRQLMRVYYGALHNPPDSVIGVGAITYAEMKLIEAQQEGVKE